MSIRVLDFTDGFESGTAPTDVTLEASEFTNAGATITLPTTTDTLVGRATTDTLTNKTMDGDLNTFQDIARSAIKAGTASHVIINDGSGVLSSESTLAKSRGGTGYDLTTAAIELPEIATPSTPASGFGRIYFKTDGKPYSLNDAGSEVDLTATGGGGGGGGDGINYITNPDAETDVTGWAAYADAAGASPVDGTGGAPTVTITRTTSSPLRDTGSFLITKDAANRQGEGSSVAFTIDRADLAKIISISFDYEVSASFVSGDSSDVRVWIYDVTNAALIQPTPFTIQGATGSTHKFNGSFQSDATSTSYRLIFHVGTTNASAWTMKMDNVKVGPEPVQYNAQVVDLGVIDVTIENTTTSNRNFAFTRVGHLMHCFGSFNSSGGSASPLAFVLPNSLNVDTTKIVANQFVGKFEQLTGTSALYASGGETNVNVFYDGTDTDKLFITASLSAGTPSKLNGSSLSSVQHRVVFTVPIAEWVVEPAAVTAVETIAAGYNTAAGQSIADVTVTILDFGTSEFDTHSAVTTGGSWKFTAPASGIYNVSACVTMAGVASDDGTNYSLYVYKNGLLDKYLAQTPKETNTTVELSIVGSVLVKLNGGEYIDVRIRQNSSVTRSLTTDADQNTISIHRI